MSQTSTIPLPQNPTASPAASSMASLCPLVLARAREHSRTWHLQSPLPQRLALVKTFRHLLVQHASDLLAALGRERPAESLSAEIIPLADACAFLEKNAARILKPRRLGRSGRPFWLRGTSATISREPFGAVLVLAPSNYPLFIPAVQCLQALVAGNAVALKPAPGTSHVAQLFSDLLLRAGFPEGLLQVVPESNLFAAALASAGFDKVVLTGSADTGRHVLASLAPTLTPATLELSGSDAVFLTSQADIPRAAAAVAFGLSLNGGKTCIAPRRIFVPHPLVESFSSSLANLLKSLPPSSADPRTLTILQPLLDHALAHGAKCLAGGVVDPNSISPILLGDVHPTMPIAQADIFAPVAGIIPVSDADQALLFDLHCPYALGASIFSGGPHDPEARLLASRARAGSIVIDDIIVPTADPRLPFGGSAHSGYGSTRGSEGLLDLTRPKAISRRTSKWLPHLATPDPADDAILAAYLAAAHSPTLRSRLSAIRNLVRAARSRPR